MRQSILRNFSRLIPFRITATCVANILEISHTLTVVTSLQLQRPMQQQVIAQTIQRWISAIILHFSFQKIHPWSIKWFMTSPLQTQATILL